MTDLPITEHAHSGNEQIKETVIRAMVATVGIDLQQIHTQAVSAYFSRFSKRSAKELPVHERVPRPASPGTRPEFFDQPPRMTSRGQEEYRRIAEREQAIIALAYLAQHGKESNGITSEEQATQALAQVSADLRNQYRNTFGMEEQEARELVRILIIVGQSVLPNKAFFNKEGERGADERLKAPSPDLSVIDPRVEKLSKDLARNYNLKD